MRKCVLLLFFVAFCKLAGAQVIINEVEADAGNFEGGGEWIELKNTGALTQDLSCWRFSNGGSLNITFPSGLQLPAGAYLLIGDASKVMCSTCDYKFLNTVFTLNADGFGAGSGAYANTIFLNTDLGVNGGCECMTGSGSINNGSLNGDRLVLFNDAGTIMDAVMFSNGDAYGVNTLTVNFAATATCPPLPSVTVPDVNDPVYDGREICNDVTGCNSSYARLPDGNNGPVVSWSQAGNLACTGCTDPCGFAGNTGSEDLPTPGIDNSSIAYTATVNGNPVNNPINTLSVCGATPVNFVFQVYNYTNVANTALQANGFLGSYTRTNNGGPVSFQTVNFNPATGVSTLSSTFIPPVGTTNYEFVWGDANTNCVTCPGSNLVAVPNDPTSVQKECYVYRKITVSREDALGGNPVASCSLPGSITVSGATGTNIKYELQKQTVAAGPFTTIAGPQNGNSFAGVIDDDADPALPNYQVLVSSLNVTCANPSPIVVPVPGNCLGNPACAVYATSGPGMPAFTPSNNSTVCAGSGVNFSVEINGVCTNGLVEVMYDHNPAFDPYTQGTSLGSTTTVIGAVPPVTTATGKVMINEFVPRPGQGACPGTPNGQNPNSGEWIELYNAGPGNVDIGGWILADGDWTATIPAGTILAANGFYLVGGGGTFCSSGSLPDLNIETCNCATVSPQAQDIMNLTDGGEQIALFDCSGNFIDGVYWNIGQGLPDGTANTAPATGCGNYITQKNVNLPALASFSNSGGSFSGSNEGRYRNASNTWTTFTYGTGTPKAANPSLYNGAVLNFGSQCPPPPVTASINVVLPDTCNQAGTTPITLKAIYKPEPVAPCQVNNVIAVSNYSIPPCELLTLSGDSVYCAPANAAITISSSAPLAGTYTLTLSNGIITTTLPVSGAGPFTTTVSDSGLWVISAIQPPIGSCAPESNGSAAVDILSIPVITSAPDTVEACYLYGYDLSYIEPQITSSPAASAFYWYDTPVGGSPINPFLSPMGTTTYYVAPHTGSPAFCEGSRVAVVLKVQPLPDIPTVQCTGNTVVFTQPNPNCIPTPCTGVQYSANGINWSNSNTYTAADPGWAGWGSPANSTLYIRNADAFACYNYVTFLNPCGAPLPAMLLHFRGMPLKDGIELQWSTIQEKQVDLFEVQKQDAGGHFVSIGEKDAAGTSNTEQAYRFTDKDPVNGLNYYRLKIADEDGQFTYSNLLAVLYENDDVQSIQIYPNPANSQLFVSADRNTESMHCTIYDVLGNTVIEKHFDDLKGSGKAMLDLQQLSAGHYVLKVNTGTENSFRKFVKE